MSRVSIVVPVFNAGSYLDECVRSIRQQTFSDIEIILVNNGSTDDSREILLDHARLDQRVLVLEKEHGSVSSARNLGLDRATSPYIQFSDADDILEPEMTESLLDAAVSSGAEMVICNYSSMDEEGIRPDTLRLQSQILYPDEGNLQDVYFQYLSPDSFGGYVWNRIYSRDLILRSGLRFEDPSEIGGEDALFNLSALLYARRITILPDSLYRYRLHAASVMHRPRTQFAQCYARMMGTFRQQAVDAGRWQSLAVVFPQLTYHFVTMGSQHNLMNPPDGLSLSRQFREMAGLDYFREAMRNLLRNGIRGKIPPGKGAGYRLRIMIFAVLILAGFHRINSMLARLWMEFRKAQTHLNIGG